MYVAKGRCSPNTEIRSSEECRQAVAAISGVAYGMIEQPAGFSNCSFVTRFEHTASGQRCSTDDPECTKLAEIGVDDPLSRWICRNSHTNADILSLALNAFNQPGNETKGPC